MSKKKDLDPVLIEGFGKDNGFGSALKIALAVVGVGVAAGATLVVGLDQIMKRLFVRDSWSGSEWEKDDWAGEDLE